LMPYNYAYSSQIQMHRCPQCKGIWSHSQALLDIEQLLINYQESLEEAKAKAMPLMMEVKRQVKEKAEVEAIERKNSRKGFFSRWFQPKVSQQQRFNEVFGDLSPSKPAEEESANSS
jgi:hypothetical protein